MLEFAAVAEIEAARSVFEKYLSNVRELASRLEKITASMLSQRTCSQAALENIDVRESIEEGAVQA